MGVGAYLSSKFDINSNKGIGVRIPGEVDGFEQPDITNTINKDIIKILLRMHLIVPSMRSRASRRKSIKKG